MGLNGEFYMYGTNETETVPPESQPLPPPIAQPTPQPRTSNQESQLEEEGDGSSNFILDQAEFIDTVVVSGAYVWLCCGITFFLLIPLVFLFLQIRGQLKLRKKDDH